MSAQVLDYDAAPPRRKYRFSRWVLLPVAVLILVELVYHVPLVRYGDGVTRAPYKKVLEECAVPIWAVVFLAGLIAVVVFILSGRRSWAANGVFAFIVTGGVVAMAFHSYRLSRATAESILQRRNMMITLSMLQASALEQELKQTGNFSAAELDNRMELEQRLAIIDGL